MYGFDEMDLDSELCYLRASSREEREIIKNLQDDILLASTVKSPIAYDPGLSRIGSYTQIVHIYLCYFFIQSGPATRDIDNKIVKEPQLNRPRSCETKFKNVLRLKQLAEYFRFKLIMAAAMIAAYCIVRQDLTEHASMLYLTVCHILVFVNFVADIILTLLSHLFGHIKIRYLKNIIYATNIVPMITSTNLLILLNTSFAPFTILLLPVIAIVVIVFCKEFKTAQDHEYQSELKKFFDLSAPLTNGALGGMIAIGYFKKFSKDIDQVPVQFSEVFIFLTVNFGLLAMLLTKVPPSLHHSKAKESLVSFIRVLSYTLFGLIALTGLAFVGEVMGRFILLAFFPIIFGVAVWFSASPVPRAMKPGLTPPRSITITILIFAVIMTVYTVYFTNEYHAFNCRDPRIFMFIFWCCTLVMPMGGFMFRILPALKPPRTERTLGNGYEGAYYLFHQLVRW